VPVSLQAEQADTGLVLDPPAPGPGPASELERSETWAALRRSLDEMGDPCREIIELRYFGELSYEEISASLKLNVKTVSSRLSKCLDRLEALVRCGREDGATVAV
jgi:RNA polymerase sigma-70 factor (ECF subfamily)